MTCFQDMFHLKTCRFCTRNMFQSLIALLRVVTSPVAHFVPASPPGSLLLLFLQMNVCAGDRNYFHHHNVDPSTLSSYRYDSRMDVGEW